MLKEDKGITLIALTVTIIVLLIIAGIAIGGGNESITLINNIFISKTTDLQFGFGEGNTDVFKLLCVNNAIKTVAGLISSHFDINSRSYGNLNTSLNYQ